MWEWSPQFSLKSPYQKTNLLNSCFVYSWRKRHKKNQKNSLLIFRIRSTTRTIAINAAITSLPLEIFVIVSALNVKWRVPFQTPLSDSRWGTFRAQVASGSRHFFTRVFRVWSLLRVVRGYGGRRTRRSNRGWDGWPANAGIPGGTCREVTELVWKAAEFFVIFFVVICFQLMIVAVRASWNKERNDWTLVMIAFQGL